MDIRAGRHELGPRNCTLHLRTHREGVAARVGHDLLLTFTSWSGLAVIPGGRPEDVSIEVSIDTTSLSVIEGTGGVAPLSHDDRLDIEKNARRLLEVERHRTATFRSTRVTAQDRSGSVVGELTVRGTAAVVRLEVTVDDEGLRATTTVRQSAFGIAPYKALFGALRLADPVDVDIRLHLDEAGQAG